MTHFTVYDRRSLGPNNEVERIRICEQIETWTADTYTGEGEDLRPCGEPRLQLRAAIRPSYRSSCLSEVGKVIGF